MDAIGRYVACFLIVVLLVLYPLQNYAYSQELVIDQIVQNRTNEYTDQIRENASLSVNEYESFLNMLNDTGDLYNVEMEFSQILKEGINDNELNLLNEDNHIHTESCNHTDDISVVNTLSTESVKKNSIRLSNNNRNSTLLFNASHVHNDNCYDHTHISESELPTKYYYEHTHDSKCIVEVIERVAYRICHKCDVGYHFYGAYSTNRGSSWQYSWSVSSSGYCDGCKTYLGQSSSVGYSFTYRYSCNYELSVRQTHDGFDSSYLYPPAGTVTLENYITNLKEPYTYKCYTYYPHTHSYTTCGKYINIQTRNITCKSCKKLTSTVRFETEHFKGFGRNENYTYDENGNLTNSSYGSYNSSGYIVNKTYYIYTGSHNCTDSEYLWEYNVEKYLGECSLGWGTKWELTCKEDLVPKCDKVVIDIQAKNAYQTVFYNDQVNKLDTTLIATFLNGSVKEINATTITGFNSSNIGLHTVYLNYIGLINTAKTTGTKSVSVAVKVIPKTKFCENGHEYKLNDDGSDDGCPYCATSIKSIISSETYVKRELGASLNLEILAVYMDNHTEYVNGWTSNYNPYQLGLQNVTIKYGDYETTVTVKVIKYYTCNECGATYQSDNDGNDPGCPYCSNRVVDLRVDLKKSIYYLGEELEIDVYAVYKDREVKLDDWTSNYNKYSIGKQLISVYYEYYSVEFEIEVASKDYIVCPICGYEYSALDYDSCPQCYRTVVGIKARNQNIENIVKQGENPDLIIEVKFRDGHIEETNKDYKIYNFNTMIIGEQSVIVGYKNFTCTLIINVVSAKLNKKACDNGHFYYLNADGSDPGCPYCAKELENKEILTYIDTMYLDEILEILYRDGKIDLRQGTLVSITVTKKTVSMTSRAQNLFNTMKSKSNSSYTCGGEVY